MAELTRDTVDRALAEVRAALDRNNVQGAIAALERLKQDEQIEVFDELDVEDQAELLPRLDPETAAEIVVELDSREQADIAERVDDQTLSRILDEMEPDDAADVIGDLPEERRQRVLANMEEADDVRPLLIHPDESAGGLMTTSFLTLRPGMTAQEAIDALREWSPDDEMPYYLFVVDRERRLVGVVPLRQLLVASPGRLIGDIMNPFRVLRRELLAGLLLGAGLGIIAFARAEVWGSGFSLSLVVGLSVLLICTWADTIGSLIPMLAMRFKIDPAVVSAPFITTLVDATGLAIYLTIARLLLPELR